MHTTNESSTAQESPDAAGKVKTAESISKEAGGPLSYRQAVAMLPKGRTIHTFRSTSFALLGCDWSRKHILEAIKEHGAQFAGPQATKMGHGLVVLESDRGALFIETKK